MSLRSLLASLRSTLDQIDADVARQDAGAPVPPLLLAKALFADRRNREGYFAPDLFGEPGWDILLSLFTAQEEGRELSTTAACEAAGLPLTTGMRWIGQLQEIGLLERAQSESDSRVTVVRISNEGHRRMLAFLRREPAPVARV